MSYVYTFVVVGSFIIYYTHTHGICRLTCATSKDLVENMKTYIPQAVAAAAAQSHITDIVCVYNHIYLLFYRFYSIKRHISIFVLRSYKK